MHIASNFHSTTDAQTLTKRTYRYASIDKQCRNMYQSLAQLYIKAISFAGLKWQVNMYLLQQ
ncbi:MAG: hypothetical protein AA908_11410 [Chlorobi bacterium NICIL-2]|nr:MAG: hypothetical protein AA908_11410 [Chlorobi bacterium NICIL-2]